MEREEVVLYCPNCGRELRGYVLSLTFKRYVLVDGDCSCGLSEEMLERWFNGKRAKTWRCEKSFLKVRRCIL